MTRHSGRRGVKYEERFAGAKINRNFLFVFHDAGNPNDKVIYPRVPSRIRSGYSTERLERRHSLRFFGHGRRSHSLQRTGSVRHISDKNDRVQHPKELASPDDVSSKSFLLVCFSITALFVLYFLFAGWSVRGGGLQGTVINFKFKLIWSTLVARKWKLYRVPRVPKICNFTSQYPCAVLGYEAKWLKKDVHRLKL